jgi:hypothetical protein
MKGRLAGEVLEEMGENDVLWELDWEPLCSLHALNLWDQSHICRKSAPNLKIDIAVYYVNNRQHITSFF